MYVIVSQAVCCARKDCIHAVGYCSGIIQFHFNRLTQQMHTTSVKFRDSLSHI